MVLFMCVIYCMLLILYRMYFEIMCFDYEVRFGIDVVRIRFFDELLLWLFLICF